MYKIKLIQFNLLVFFMGSAHADNIYKVDKTLNATSAGTSLIHNFFPKAASGASSNLEYILSIFSNLILLGLLVLIIYLIVAGILQLAITGEFLNSEQNNLFYIIRIFVGLALFTKPAGASLPWICLLVIHIAHAGSHVADNVWNKIYLDYAAPSAGGNTGSKPADFNDIISNNSLALNSMIQGLACVNYINKVKLTKNLKPGITAPTTIADIFQEQSVQDYENKYKTSLLTVFLSEVKNQPINVNGKLVNQYMMNFSIDNSGYSQSPDVTSCGSASGLTFQQAAAGYELMSDINPVIKTAVEQYTSADKNGLSLVGIDSYIKSAEFEADIQKYIKNYNKQSSNSTPPISNQTKYGWMFAGIYYNFISSPSNGTTGNVTGITTFKPKKVPGGHTFTLSSSEQKQLNSIRTNLDNNLSSLFLAYSGQSNQDNMQDLVYELWAKITTTNIPVISINIFDYPASGLFENQIKIGKLLIQISLQILPIVFTSIFGITLAASIMDCESPTGNATQGMMGIVLFVITVVVAIGVTQGVLLAIVIPIVPVIIYSVAVIGWLMSLLEGVIAAPIVALGLLMPGKGHEILGKSENAISLYLNILIRPVLIVIGFIASIILCRLALDLLALFLKYSFYSPDSIIDINIGLAIIASIPMLFLYTAAILFITQHCFGLLTKLPDNVMKWVSGHAVSYGNTDKILQQLQETSSDYAGNVAGVVTEQFQATKSKFDATKQEIKDRKKQGK